MKIPMYSWKETMRNRYDKISRKSKGGSEIMCHNSDNIIVDLNFKPIAIGMSLGQHNIGVYKESNIYIRKYSLSNNSNPVYFIQMSQKAFNKQIMAELPSGCHEEKFAITKKQLFNLKESLK